MTTRQRFEKWARTEGLDLRRITGSLLRFNGRTNRYRTVNGRRFFGEFVVVRRNVPDQYLFLPTESAWQAWWKASA